MIDRIGMIFGRLAIKSVAPESHPKNIKYICTCSCGNEKTIGYKNMRCGSTKSCGCLAKENMEILLEIGAKNKAKKLEQKKIKEESRALPKNKHSLYKTWRGMITRCYDSKTPMFKYYGGRGISICESWLGKRSKGEIASIDGFETFLADMGAKPTLEHSIDRINSDGNYEPNNCRWATIEEQSNNRTNSLPVGFRQSDVKERRRNKRQTMTATIKGKTQSVNKWAKQLDITYQGIKKFMDIGEPASVAVLAAKLKNTEWKRTSVYGISKDKDIQYVAAAKNYLNTLDKT